MTSWLICVENVSQKSEDNLASSESELDKQTKLVSDLTRKVDELQHVSDEAVRLKDQLDEYVRSPASCATKLTSA